MILSKFEKIAQLTSACYFTLSPISIGILFFTQKGGIFNNDELVSYKEKILKNIGELNELVDELNSIVLVYSAEDKKDDIFLYSLALRRAFSYNDLLYKNIENILKLTKNSHVKSEFDVIEIYNLLKSLHNSIVSIIGKINVYREEYFQHTGNRIKFNWRYLYRNPFNKK